MTIGNGFPPEDVFLVVAFENGVGTSAEISIVMTIDEVNGKLEELTYGNTKEDSIKVYSGVIISALNLPKSFHGVIPYILVANKPKFSDKTKETYIYFDNDEEDDYRTLNLEKLCINLDEADFASGPPDQEGMVEKIEMLVDAAGVAIDDILLFFGYELVKILQISEDGYDDDEELVIRLDSIKNDVCML